MTTPKTVLVTGATGNQGGAVVDGIRCPNVVGLQQEDVTLKDGEVPMLVTLAALPVGDDRLAIQ